MLAVLVLVHELGHFLVAKWSGIRVDEFGIGFPPRLFRLWKRGETEYTVNALPFGGFVKIFGENPDEDSISGVDSARSMINKPRYIQALVLVAGVTFNFIFAWLLISLGFMIGLPASLGTTAGEVRDANLVITNVVSGSPAEKAGMKAGDNIISIYTSASRLVEMSPENVADFITSNPAEITFETKRKEDNKKANVTPVDGVVGGKKAIGISMDMVGIVSLPIHKAFFEGGKTTLELTKNTVIGLVGFISNAFLGKANLGDVTGPVGIVGIVGDATSLGFVYLLSFSAFISINLAVINLLPFPAIDGGRLLFVAIESIKRSRINPKVTNTLNAIGFILLILLMLAVTISDVIKLFV